LILINLFANTGRPLVNENEALTAVMYVENEELSPVDFNRVISGHIEDIANQKDVLTKSSGE
jgi:hypothetical protein